MSVSSEYSIGNVAEMLKLPVHTIRFWTETFEHIEIIKRNGRRYYDEKSVEELKKIKELSHKKGIKIDGIKQMLRYNKINMDKLEEANKSDICLKLESSIRQIDKIIDKLNTM